VVAVGGATLGGSGKTPLAIACAGELASAGASVALVGHAYRARPGRARVVSVHDALGEVGDEALVAARALAPTGARVVVAPRRQDAVALAARIGDVLVLDGIGQTTPISATLALLAVDAQEPWGRAAAVAPRGDLRAPIGALRRACDLVVALHDDGWGACDGSDCPCSDAMGGDHAIGSDACAFVSSRGAWLEGTLLPWDDLSRMRLGLICALGRPERLQRFLARRGVVPVRVLRGPDHGPLAAGRCRLRARGEIPVDAWLATPKCALHAPHAPHAPEAWLTSARACDRRASGALSPAAPLATLDHGLVLGQALRRELFSVLS
jgi:tetraacyldisaccharide 4'-kinase